MLSLTWSVKKKTWSTKGVGSIARTRPQSALRPVQVPDPPRHSVRIRVCLRKEYESHAIFKRTIVVVHKCEYDLLYMMTLVFKHLLRLRCLFPFGPFLCLLIQLPLLLADRGFLLVTGLLLGNFEQSFPNIGYLLCALRSVKPCALKILRLFLLVILVGLFEGHYPSSQLSLEGLVTDAYKFQTFVSG
mmetsp:Transcript_39135/g.93720  ORF Transcript_39135/g.93720 Transcript_39135/m.93720 type:complete len:188 (+) Transcript_39135:1258-1821(+)